MWTWIIFVYAVAKFDKNYQHLGLTSYNRKVDKARRSIKNVLQLQVQEYFRHNNDCKTPYIDIYIDLLPINFNLLSIL